MKNLRIIGGLMLCFLACACNPVDELVGQNPQSGDFSGSLAAEYARFAQAQQEHHHKALARKIADKGLRALQGEAVEPETLATAKLSSKLRKVLQKDRTRLTGYLTPSVKQVIPRKLARTQLFFDCAVIQLQEKQATLARSPCYGEFRVLMRDIESASLLVPLREMKDLPQEP